MILSIQLQLLELYIYVNIFHSCNGSIGYRSLQGYWVDASSCSTASTATFNPVMSHSTPFYIDNIKIFLSSRRDLNHTEKLFLHGNKLTGPILPEFGNMIKLHYLELNDNELKGRVPPELGKLTELFDL